MISVVGIENQLQRIADALEMIAESMEGEKQ